jgi:hypothetical protein
MSCIAKPGYEGSENWVPPSVYCSPDPGDGDPPPAKNESQDTVSSWPECNPDGPGTPLGELNEKKLNFITADYNAALKEATSIVNSVPKSNVSAGALATMFLQWSMWESGYSIPDQWAQHVAENNYFGEQQSWQGSVTCPSNPNILSNTKNACFPSSMTWGQELTNALDATSGSTGVTFLSALEKALPNGSIAGDLQAIADNGWRPKTPNYGAKITGVSIQRLINCALENGYIKP